MNYDTFQDISEILIEARQTALKLGNKVEAKRILALEAELAKDAEENPMAAVHNQHKFGKK